MSKPFIPQLEVLFGRPRNLWEIEPHKRKWVTVSGLEVFLSWPHFLFTL